MTRPIAPTAGVHHVGLTVPNLASAQKFFEEALRFEPILGNIRLELIAPVAG